MPDRQPELRPCSSPETIAALADGSHTFAVRAVDGSGNPDPSPAERTFKVDTVKPEASISCPPAPAPANSSPVTCTIDADDPGPDAAGLLGVA